jgi:hypothetical protein
VAASACVFTTSLQQTCPSLRPLSKGLHNKQNRQLNLTALKYLKQEPQKVDKGPYQ